MAAPRGELPAWVDVGLIPLLNLSVALIVAGLVVVIIGESPLEALTILLKGAIGSLKGWSYLLYYATNFVFTGLAVAVAFHAGLFNIGGEGQVYIAGLGAGMVGLGLEFIPWPVALPLAILACSALGALWALIPGYLQARRGSHIVITTIMFNFIAASLMVFIIVNIFRPMGRMAVESREITNIVMPSFRQIALALGTKLPNTPLNVTIFLAIAAAFAVWYLLWRTKLGYEIRCFGANPDAAVYAGIKPGSITMIAMAISGGLAGLMAVNEILGVQHRMVLEFAGGAGFVGIAVALMGRSHPAGVVLAAMLFGLLYQGGAELSFARPAITHDMIVVIQGLVILFMGALEPAFRPALHKLFVPQAG